MCAASYPGPPLGQGDDQIRLLTVLGGLPDDPVDCALGNHSIGEIRTAEAVSYAWGSTACTKVILVNGTPFHVGENLFQALVHLRRPATHRLLWIDAVCINQSDITERNHQVQKMAAIYSGANRVLIWLGLETADSKAAFDFLHTAYQRSPYNREELMHHEGWLVLEELCSREYWTRVWIVQEICLASRLILCCGTSQIPWAYLSEIRRSRKNVWPRYMSSGEQAFMRSLPARIDQQKESRTNNRGCSLWALLEAFQSSQCKEIHDKVYGFMGLSTDCGSSGIPIDYSRSVRYLYNDVILYYHRRFRSKSYSPTAAQLISLSEFLQKLLVCHAGGTLPHGLHHTVTVSDQILVPDVTYAEVVEVSAFSTLVVDKFLSSSDAAEYSATNLVQFLNGEIPYSHLGFFRDFIDHRVSGVSQVGPLQASLIFDDTSTAFDNELEVEAINRPSAFIASPVTRYDNLGEEKTASEAGFVIGIAPPGTRRGDLVCTFVDSLMVLVVRPCPENAGSVMRVNLNESRTLKPRRKVFKPVVGRAVVDLSRSTWVPSFKSILNLDKTVQVTQMKSLVDERETPWSATLVIDLPSLQRLTSSTLEVPPINTPFSAILDLLPIRESPTLISQRTDISRPSSPEDMTVAEGKRAANDNARDSHNFVDTKPVEKFEENIGDDEMERLREDPELRRHALGPGYGGIINLGSTGYLSCALQLFYMTKPVRDAVLQMSDPKGSLVLIELQNLFRHLHDSSFPVSPLGLTKSFGWLEHELNQPRDVGQFIEKFQDLIQSKSGPVPAAFKATFGGECISSNGRSEELFHIAFQAPLGSLKAGVAAMSAGLSYLRLPAVCIVMPMFSLYNADKDTMEIWRGRFVYPPAFKLSDFVAESCNIEHSTSKYQLIGLIVLEEVQPVAKWLLYLRPRRGQDRWLLFFNDAVTFAREGEVFEDSFGGHVAPETPFRIPYVFVYAREDKLEDILG